MGGSVGQAVSGMIWLISAALATWVDVKFAMIALALGGIFIFPLTQLTIKLLGHKASLSKSNPFNRLAMQIAFIIPLNLPVIAAAAMYNQSWFYPAFMIVVGTHYMPFVFLYGMWQYALLAAALIGGGVLIGMPLSANFIAGGWFTAVILLVFAFVVSRTSASWKKNELQATGSI